MIASQSTILNLGKPYDDELDDFYVEEWGIKELAESEIPPWITFLNETVDAGVKFMMEPALEDAGKEYKLYFKLSDLNTNDPQSNEFEVKVLVIKPFEEIIEEVVIEVVKEEVKVDI